MTDSRQRGLDAFVRAVTLVREKVESFERYPFSIPAVRALDSLDLHPKVTLLAYPDATIYGLGANGVTKVAYEDTEHYALPATSCRTASATCGGCSRTARGERARTQPKS